ncbi:MAG TPA: Ig-like domain-containing protein, partial [Gemmatimonadaceae bacterium]|nr:Ig-like domain-containing protein [Gemmatimonadaceae bacterium]
MRRLVAAGTFALAIVGFGCSEGSKSTAPPQVTYIIVLAAPQPTVMDGQTMQLSVSVTRSDGQTLGAPAIIWSTSDSSIATVNPSGLLSTKSAGSVTVTAAAYGASAKTGVRVLPAPRDSAANIVAESVYVGQTIDLRAYLLNNGNPAFTDSTTWTSSDPTVGTVAGGVFTALKRGVSTVTGTRGTRVGVVDVLAQTHVKSLTLAPDSIQLPFGTPETLYALASDSAGKPLYGRAVTWSVSDSTKFAINAGVLTTKFGGAPTSVGATTITAVSEGAVATAFVTVTAPSGYTIALTAPQSFLQVGKALQLSSKTQDPWNFYLANAALNWSSSDSTIARVSSTGVVTGVARGKVTINAEADGRKGAISLSVEKPVATVFFAPDTVFIGSHGSLVPAATLRDADGNSLAMRPLTWTSSDTSIVIVGTNAISQFQASARGTVGHATISASVDGIVGTLNVIVTSGTDRLFFFDQTQSAASYSTYDAQLDALDAFSVPISGRGVRIVSSDPGIVSVQPDTAAFANGSLTLHVTAGHSGDATLTATSGTVSTIGVVHVAPVAITLRIVSKPAELALGTTYRLTTNITQHVIDWTTSDASIATVSDSGVVTGLGGGAVRIVARARDALGAAADSATISVRAQQAPVVTAVSSPQLQAGTSVTLTGQNFSTTPGANVVSIDGVPVQVTAVTATQLNITLPPTTSFPCQATHLAPLVVSTGPGLLTTLQQMLASAPQDSLAVGDADFWTPADSRCHEFVTKGSLYLLTISNGGTSASPWTGFSFMVDTGSFASSIVPSNSRIPLFSRSLTPAAPHGMPAPGVLRINMDSVRRVATAHRNLLEKNRKLASRLGSPLPLLRRAARVRPNADLVAAAATVPDTGTKMFIRVPQLDTPDFCGDYRTIQARVVYSGTHSIILEDVQAPLAGLMDSYYQSVGTEFDATTYNVITSNFGDPMAMDQSLGGPGRVTMVFTPAVNEMGPTGFVVSCDFYPETSAASSNQREMFYAVVPTSTAPGFNGEFTRDAWLHIIRSTVAHETKHIASVAEHFARQAPQQEESWLEEGTAMIAMELYARTVTPLKWKSGNGYNSALYCDVRPTTCIGQPYTMFDHFIYLHDYLTPSEQHTPLGSTSPTDASFYGSVWWLTRWAVDQYATDEGAFFRALTQEPSLTGVANLSARTGRVWGDLLRDWSLATLTSYLQPTFLIQNFTPHDARLTTPTWRLRDVFDG